MNKYSTTIEDMVKRYRKLYSGLVYDALADMGLRDQTLSLHIKPLDNKMVVAGPAYTFRGVREVEKETDEEREKMFQMRNGIYKNCVVVVDSERDNQCGGHWGDLNSTAAQAKGANGIVIDGGIRDGRMHLEMKNYSVFVRYTSPIESNGRWKLKDCQVPISMTGTTTPIVNVRPGDWVFGDMDAVLIIPSEIADKVLIKAEEIDTAEKNVRAALGSGETIKAVYQKYPGIQ
jgi:regulator of RNase E activity RraA